MPLASCLKFSGWTRGEALDFLQTIKRIEQEREKEA